MFASAGGLASDDPIEVQSVARRCLKMWDTDAGGGRSHRQSRRFLEENYSEPNDPSLRPAVELLSQGVCFEDLPEHDMQAISKWLAAFKLACNSAVPSCSSRAAAFRLFC